MNIFDIFINIISNQIFSSGLRGGSGRARLGLGQKLGKSRKKSKFPQVVREPPGTTGGQPGALPHPKNTENR